jgi:tetratricopeptide (TPR) repeat protein
MPSTKGIPCWAIGILLTVALGGCATPRSQPAAPQESLHPGYEVVYYPQIQSGMTFESVKRDWVALLPSTTFYDNRLEHGDSQKTLFYYQLLSPKIVVESKPDPRGDYVIMLPGVLIHERKLANAQKLADALLFLQAMVKKVQADLDAELQRFEPVAAQYRALAVKPPIPEEQRRLIVQANALSAQKKYAMAIEQYKKANAIDPTSYPGAYFNMALLCGQVDRPVSAIFYMKQYLLLAPDAQDARGAQDKIYEWELLIQ